MTSIDQVICVTPERGGGWGPVTLMAELAAQVFDAELAYVHPVREYSVMGKALSFLPRRRSSRGVLVIAAHPGDLLAMSDLRFWAAGAGLLVAWIIDSFWSDRIPRFVRGRGALDAVFVTDHELVDEYASAVGAPAYWLPWGTDTLAVPPVADHRVADVLRVGRQPLAWADDDANAVTFGRAGLVYAGRPSFGRSPGENRNNLLASMAQAKMVMVWGNAQSPAEYTHPTREYISARWTDAMACGAQVLGIPPNTVAAGLLGDSTFVVPESLEPDAVVEVASLAADGWTASAALGRQLHAVEYLDWRHRLLNMSDILGLDGQHADAEKVRLDARAAQLREALAHGC